MHGKFKLEVEIKNDKIKNKSQYYIDYIVHTYKSTEMKMQHKNMADLICSLSTTLQSFPDIANSLHSQ